ncbi:hypothetical protein CIK97_06245 [Prevotella sp. P3-120]|nr:hypothetical protein CIK97_06245 [Prevotella sp. P3-120]OYP52008.1 hypothetical protein CIK93_04065 [Prevotella sp. P3-92]
MQNVLCFKKNHVLLQLFCTKHMNSQLRGVVNGIISGVSFGMIPLFSIPVIAAGMDNVSILVYRFLFGSAAMLAILLLRKTNMRVSLSELLRIVLLAIFYITTALATLECYKYLSSGIATALVYTDPIWCALIGLAFLGDKFSIKLTSSILLASLGVMMMTGVFSGDGTFSMIGLLLGLASGLAYGIYLILVPRLKVKHIASLKLTFYVFFTGMWLLIAYSLMTNGGVEEVPDSSCWLDLALLGLIPTAISNICVTVSLKLIDSTIVAILGAFEPLTAMVVGVVILGEPLGFIGVVGGMLILVAVAILTINPQKLKLIRK